jgi:iron complex outermembrane receptor protein
MRLGCVVLTTLLAGAIVSPASLFAQSSASAQLPALKQLSLEELLEVDVTLPLRRESSVREAPAAISVATAEDIRRSGAVNLPEALRHMPGLFVARFNATSWVVTARGFASNAANKMLVMIDGRSVYSPLFSGVFWDQQDAMLLDLDRIEVVRGPGTSLWGSNAVNGVINVVSKAASETQGTLVQVGGGAEEQLHAAVRYGDRAGGGHFRVYGKYFVRDGATLDDGRDAGDGQRFGQGGFRADFGDVTDSSFTIQGDAHVSRSGLLGRDNIEASGLNVLARWTRRASSTSNFALQLYADHSDRMVPAQIRERRNTFDIDLQHRFAASDRHMLSWGGGYRRSADDTTPSALLFFEPEDRTTHLITGFLQDDIMLTSSLSAILGAKLERNDYTGIEAQPTARIRWTPSPSHTVWGGVSRGIRMPTRIDTDVRVRVNNRIAVTGNPEFRSESLVATELGYRGNAKGQLAWDVVVFDHDYDDIRTQELGAPIVVGNGANIASRGMTATGTVQPRPSLRFTASYSYLHYVVSLDPGSNDLYGGRNETIDPSHQAFVLSRVDLPGGVDLDLSTRYVSAIPNPGTPAYWEAGFRVGWRMMSNLELSLVGRDVLHDSHFEFLSPTSASRTRLERALFARVTVAY